MKTTLDACAFDSRRRPYERGLTLIDCLTYIGLLAVILTLAFTAFFRTTEHSRNLSRNAADIVRTLHAGERWREDVRTASGPPQLKEENGVPTLRLRRGNGEIAYQFRDSTIFRREPGLTNWVAILPSVKSSSMHAETRRHIICWHWDLELQGRQKVARVRPLFSFATVQKAVVTP